MFAHLIRKCNNIAQSALLEPRLRQFYPTPLTKYMLAYSVAHVG